MMAIRLSTEDRNLLDGLVKRRAEEFESAGVEVTASSIIRSLIRRAAREVGLTESPSGEQRPKTSKKQQ